MDTQSLDLPQSTDGSKRRWRRNRIACDSCHTRRVRCDRAFPCSRCLRSDIHCEFTRELRKRGRIARSKQTTTTSDTLNVAENGIARDTTARKEINGENGSRPTQPALSPMQDGSPASTFRLRSPVTNQMSILSAPSVDDRRSVADGLAPQRTGFGANATEEWLSAANLSPESYEVLGGADAADGPLPRLLDIWHPVDLVGHRPQRPSTRMLSVSGPNRSRYPVLEPVMPFLESNLPRQLVCDLLELYFTSAFSTHMHPVCHHIHCYVLRKASFLSTDRPRPSSPALLASMLWVAAVDDRAFSLSISPLQRRKICQFLCALTIRLLRPLIHVSFKDQEPTSSGENNHAAAAQDFAAAAAHHSFEGVGDDKGLVGPAGTLDDVVTYIHVASIISSSEQKAASMRWSVVLVPFLAALDTDTL